MFEFIVVLACLVFLLITWQIWVPILIFLAGAALVVLIVIIVILVIGSVLF